MPSFLAHRMSVRLAYQRRSLIWQFVKRDVQSRYRESWLGVTWTFLTPLLMLGVYTFVFRDVFQSRWVGSNEGGIDFALRLYAGLVVFSFFSECISRAPTLIVEQPNLVKKVVFPLELLSWISVCSALVHLGISASILVVAALATDYVHASAWLLPLVWLPLFPLVLGLSWFLSALGVYVRDISPLIGLVVSFMMFMSPVFYPLSALPDPWGSWMALNPLATIIEGTRQVLLDGHLPEPEPLLAQFAAALVIAVLGHWWFSLTRRGFADVL